MTQVIYNRTYNYNIKDHDRTFRLEVKTALFDNKWGCHLCRPYEEVIKEIPHVEQTVNMAFNRQTDVTVGENTINVLYIGMSKPGVEFFCGKLLYGSSKTWDYGATAIVNRSTAGKLFGTDKAVGKTFTLKENGVDKSITVVGVSEDMPDNCSIGNGLYMCENPKDVGDASEWSFNIFVRLDDPANKAAVERAFKKEVMRQTGYTDEKKFEKEYGQSFRLTPVDDIYFSGVGLGDKGNRNLVNVLTVASVFILFIALLNLLNFTLSEVPMRIRSINTRRVMGASQSSLRLQMIMENVGIAFIGLLMAFLIVMGFQRSETCMNLVSGDISFGANAMLATVMAVAALAVGALSAVVPAWYSTSFTPAMVLKGSFGLSPRGRKLRMAIMGVQFCVAFVLAIYIGVMASQSNYIFNSDYGFAKNEVLFTELTAEACQKKTAIRAELQKLPYVESVGYAQDAIGVGDQYMGWFRGNGDKSMNMQVMLCDPGYLHTMGLKIEEGRDFNESDSQTGAYILNRTMMDKYKWLHVGDSIGSRSEWGDHNYLIVGVCNNFRMKSVRNDNSILSVAFLVLDPLAMSRMGDRCYNLFVRVAEGHDKIEAKRGIEKVLNRLDASYGDYKMKFFDDALQRTYVDEFRFISQVKLFAIICIIITIIGVFSLTMFETEYRRKEIGIRKVMGSSVGAVVRLFAVRYSVPLVVSFVIAAPLGYWLSRQWLQSFAEHTPIYWWLFPLSFVGVSAVVVLTVVAQSWRVATENPVESIKTE